jgi:hypothetical protein
MEYFARIDGERKENCVIIEYGGRSLNGSRLI